MDISIELVSVLTNRELLIVIDGNVDLLSADRFVVRVVELAHIWMSESLISGQSLMRVEM